MPHKRHLNTLRRVALDNDFTQKEFRRAVRSESSPPLATQLGKVAVEDQGSFSGATSSEIVQGARNHWLKYQSEYHDLAAIDAHLEGVTIDVAEPLVIGQKVEVKNQELPAV